MKLIPRCAFCDSVWVDWNIKLEMTEQLVYAHNCYECGRVQLKDHSIHNGVPYLILAITHRVKMRHRNDKGICDGRVQHQRKD